MAAPGLITTTTRVVNELWKIQARVDATRTRTLMKGGAIVRGIMRRRIRFRKNKRSSPGQSPFAHVSSSSFGLRTIFYAYDPNTRSVAIGPIVGNDNSGAPHALEFGGRAMVRLNRRQRRKLGRKRIRAFYRPRPFSLPSLETFSSKYPNIWKDTI